MKHEQKEISTDVGYVLSVITKITSKSLKHDVRREFNECIPPPPVIDLNVKSNTLTEEQSKGLSQKLLMSTNSSDYNMIRQTINETVNQKFLPSLHMITKHRPELDNGIVECDDKFLHILPKSDRNERMVERSDNDDDFVGKKNKIKARYFSKIKGGVRKYHEIMVDKLAIMNKSVDMSRLIAFDSFDGANHLETVEGNIDLVSFNSTIVNRNF